MAATNTYVIGIAGTGTGALAGLLQAAGHKVRGSDAHIYPPMDQKLAEWGIEVLEGFDPAHLTPAPDLVVVGNVVRRDNVEAAEVRARDLPFMSMPQALAHYGIGARHSMVVAGTHGKTTTTALLAHVLVAAGRDPGFLVGGALLGYRESFRLGGGDTFVVEGDEYDTAYFDKGPKFLHYRGKTVIVTSIEFDHADIYRDIEAIELAFAKLLQQVGEDGHIIVWGGAARALKLLGAPQVRCRQVTVYGTEVPREVDAANLRRPHTQLVPKDVQRGANGIRFTLAAARGEDQDVVYTVPLWGAFGLDNALAVVAACRHVNVPDAAIVSGLASFAGVRRRLEVRGTFDGITLVDDFGHHPTAVAATLQAARDRWPGRKVWALFEPRSATSRRNTFEDAYVAAFAGADHAVVAHHARLGEVPEDERFSPARVAKRLRDAGTPAAAPAHNAEIVAYVAQHARPGDVLLCMSNGDFAGLLPALEGALAARTST